MDQPAVKNLVERAKKGDKGSFRKLVETHQPFIYAVAFRMLCNDYEAEEVVQETFIRVWNHLDGFDSAKQFGTWLYKIAVNLCYDRIRTGNRRKTISTDSSFMLNIAGDECLESKIINSDLASTILILTEGLTPKQKLVFTLSELEGLSFDEVSEITGMSHAKITSNLYCARHSIKAKLECMELKSDSHVR